MCRCFEVKIRNDVKNLKARVNEQLFERFSSVASFLLMLVASEILSVLLLEDGEVEIAYAAFPVIKILPTAIYALVLENIGVVGIYILEFVWGINVKKEKSVRVEVVVNERKRLFYVALREQIIYAVKATAYSSTVP